MVRRICLDTDIIIHLLSKDQHTRELIESLDADFFTVAINAFELWYGRKENESVFELLEWLDVLPLDEKSALTAADILRELKKTGTILDIKDLFIGAICITQRIELLTLNRKHFDRLQKFGLVLVEITPEP